MAFSLILVVGYTLVIYKCMYYLSFIFQIAFNVFVNIILIHFLYTSD